METEVLVIGGGAAGMMAAARAAEQGVRVTLLEKNPFCGKKINITGKGRCNLTNARRWDEFSAHIHPSAALLKNAFYGFSNDDTVKWFNDEGMPTVLERGERIFPASKVARDVSKTLAEALLRRKVEARTNCEVLSLKKEADVFKCTFTESGKEGTVSAKAVIVATGGLSYPTTGSTGAGYGFAGNFGIEVVKTLPSLTALKPDRYDPMLEGIDLENVGLALTVDRDTVQREQGDLSFTSDGIEGSLGFRVSRKAVHALNNSQKVTLVLDLKPALDKATLEKRIDRELAGMNLTRNTLNAKTLCALLRKLMPEALVGPFIAVHKDLSPSNLAASLKEWQFRITSYVGYERCVVTMGGVSQKEIVPKSMESRKVPGLYFAGEVLDLDGDTGGYNLQIAFSTGALAGRCAAQKILKAKSSE